MPHDPAPLITRRAALTVGASLLAAPALAQSVCDLGLPGHVEGPHVWRDYDQEELDAAYDQEFYQPHTRAVNSRLSSLSFDLRFRRSYPERVAYGESADEAMDIHRAPQAGGSVFVFIHGGIWLHLDASSAGFTAEMVLDRGALVGRAPRSRGDHNGLDGVRTARRCREGRTPHERHA